MIVGWGAAASVPRSAHRSSSPGIRAGSDRRPGNRRHRQLKPVETSGASQVVLVLAPVGRDADVAVSVLRTAGMVAEPCKSVSELNAFLRAEGNSVGALLLTEESLPSSMEYSGVTEWPEHQEPWSDLPIIFLTHPGTPTRKTAQRSRRPGLRGAVTVLQRPVRPGALGGAVPFPRQSLERPY